MTQACADLFERSNSGTDSLVGQNDQIVGRFSALRKCFKQIWPKKTTIELALATDVTVRQAERVLGGDQGLSATALCRLIQGEHGILILRTIMGTASPQWWKDYALGGDIVELRRDLKRRERRLRELEEATGS